MQEKSIKKYINSINFLAQEIKRPIKLMEVCGTHTQVIAQYGIKKILPENIKLLSGPGCPVCVTDQKDIDAAVALARAGVPVATYGDAIRVKGSSMSLAEAKQRGAKIYEVYSIEEAFSFGQDAVFLGIGFETTAPMTASAIKRGLKVYSAHKAFVPAMEFLLKSGEINVDGLISPGHVAAICGVKSFEHFKTRDGRKMPQVITGFELRDVLSGIFLLLKQIKKNYGIVENEYSRVVTERGNEKAQKLLEDVFEIKDSSWRGLGEIPGSGFEIKTEFSSLDAKVIYKSILEKEKPPKKQNLSKCLCPSVIRGLVEAGKCPLFGKNCTPDNPEGPCMVSREGACHVAYESRR